MIKVTKLNKTEFYLNPALIETIEVTPDTIITLINGKKFLVKENVEEVIKKIEEYYEIAHLIPPHITMSGYEFKEK